MFTISLKSGDLETIHEMYSHTYTNLELPVLRTKSDIDWWPVQTHEGPPTSAFASLPGFIRTLASGQNLLSGGWREHGSGGLLICCS